MRNELVAAPILVPLLSAAAGMIAWRSPRLQRRFALTGCAVLLVAAVALVAVVAYTGPAVVPVGNWPAPIGVELRVDLLGALMVLITAVIGLACAIYAGAEEQDRQHEGGPWPLLMLLLMGVDGAFVTGDLFDLYVWFEVMLIASFVLLTYRGGLARLRGGLVYVILSLIGSTLFLIAVGLLYAGVRALDLTQLAERLTELRSARPRLVLAIEGLLLASFGLKAAVFPLFFWLPASYHTPPAWVSALFAALLTKVGVYAMIRVAAGVFPPSPVVDDALVVVAGLTMITGVLGALAHAHLRRILGFHIISQIGYMVAGLALATGDPAARRFAVAAAIFYVLHHIIVKANLFLIAGVIRRVRGTEALAGLGGVARSHPWLVLPFLVAAFSLAGLPPLSGFWAKLGIIQAGVAADRGLLVTAAVVAGLLTLLSMVKIWTQAFAGPVPAGAPAGRLSRARALRFGAPIMVLAALTVAIGLYPEPLFELALGAADHVLRGGGR
jgi:multicomponent Na+:H+ antiporter subunit D